MRQPGEISQLSAGGPRAAATWCLNPQYWLTLRPPPASNALSHVRISVSAALPEDSALSEPPPLLGFTLLKVRN